MSANRKLLAEVQSTLKKVEEGVILFDEVWEKVYSAGQQALKEKYEGDLKKEIKKLQRLRDQIKVWISSSEIKDKGALTEARKIIELKMEQFKVCEKDTKTKAFSKEGLAREAKLDPKEADKEDKVNWLNSNMDKLNDLVDSLEADLEKLSKGGKSKNKEQTDNLTKRIKKYKWHILRMDTLIKLIDNDDLDPSKLDAIRDDVDYFVENAAEDDSASGVDDEFDIYEELQLDSIPIAVKDLGSGTHEESGSDQEDEDGKSGGKSASKKAAAAGTPIPLANIGKAQAVKPGAIPVPVKSVVAAAAKVPPTTQPVTAAPTAAGDKKAAVPTPVIKSPSLAAGTPGVLPAVQSLPQARVSEEKAGEAPPLTSWASAATQRPTLAQTIKSPPTTAIPAPAMTVPSVSSVSEPPSQRQAGPPAITLARPEMVPVEPVYSPPPATQILQQQQQQQQQASVESKLGAINPEIMIAINMLKQSMLYCPLNPDGEKPPYTPRNPYPTHPAFPTQPPAILESPALFEKLPMDTLFLAFYHQQGLYQQVLAAKQLKKQSWRFHKKYMTWFQRHEEPKRTELNFEEGTYVYFDYESGWCQRIKSEFKFEYAYLEDEQQPQN